MTESVVEPGFLWLLSTQIASGTAHRTRGRIHNMRDDPAWTRYQFLDKPYVVARSESEVRRIVGITSSGPS